MLRLWTATSSQEKLETEKMEALRHLQCDCVLETTCTLCYGEKSQTTEALRGQRQCFLLSLISMIFSPVFMTYELVETFFFPG